jgi:hypothetical protein
MPFIENHYGIQWKLWTQNISSVTNVTKSHVTCNIYSMKLHVATTLFGHKACNMLCEKLQSPSYKVACC